MSISKATLYFLQAILLVGSGLLLTQTLLQPALVTLPAWLLAPSWLYAEISVMALMVIGLICTYFLWPQYPVPKLVSMPSSQAEHKVANTLRFSLAQLSSEVIAAAKNQGIELDQNGGLHLPSAPQSSDDKSKLPESIRKHYFTIMTAKPDEFTTKSSDFIAKYSQFSVACVKFVRSYADYKKSDKEFNKESRCILLHWYRALYRLVVIGGDDNFELSDRFDYLVSSVGQNFKHVENCVDILQHDMAASKVKAAYFRAINDLPQLPQLTNDVLCLDYNQFNDTHIDELKIGLNKFYGQLKIYISTIDKQDFEYKLHLGMQYWDKLRGAINSLTPHLANAGISKDAQARRALIKTFEAYDVNINALIRSKQPRSKFCILL